MRVLKSFRVKNKRILVRCDFNVPLDQEGNILDDFRIRETLPTIEYLVRKGAKIILMSHLGEPEGKAISILRMDKVQEKLAELLKLSVVKMPDCVGSGIEKQTQEMKSGEILLLENLRFHKEEIQGNQNFAKSLAKLGDIFIQEAFSACHRPHASVVGVPKFLPSGIGFLAEKEIKNLEKLFKKPEKPMLVIIGGEKAETKARFINKISEIADFILVGDLIKQELEEKKIKIKHPKKLVFSVDYLGADGKKLDIGPRTAELFREKILKAKTIFWNGPLGLIGNEDYKRGTTEIAKAIAESKAFSVAGGGETVDLINDIGLAPKFSHISTGGGAMLQFLSGEELPGLKILKEKRRS